MKLTYNNKTIGEITNRTFGKTIDENKHLMRIFESTPGIQDTIDQYLDEFDNIVITTKQGRAFKTTKELWLANRFAKNLGFGRQYFMARKHWQIVDFTKNLTLIEPLGI